MIMNKIFNKIGRCVFVLGIMMAGVATFTACSSNDDPFYTVSENDYKIFKAKKCKKHIILLKKIMSQML